MIPERSPETQRTLERFLGPYTFLGAAVIALVIAAAWIGRRLIWRLVGERSAVVPAVLVGLLVAWVILTAGLGFEYAVQRRTWRRRTERLTRIGSLASPWLGQRLWRRLPDPLEWLAGPLLRTAVGRRLTEDWIDAGLGNKASRFLLLIGFTGWVGAVLGARVDGPVLSVAFAALLPLLPSRLVRRQAEVSRRRFGEQLPTALDSLAAGMSAGLSFQQAVEYASEELPSPVREATARLARRLALGHPVDEALAGLLEAQPDEAFALVVDGIALQRQFGGDLVAMLEDTARLLRGRVELEREVRAVTSQGRLSGLVVGMLVPVSAFFLLTFNPQYIDILFDTLIGQTIVVIAILLQLAGWAIISRLVRIRY